jgi:hypothetical protein
MASDRISASNSARLTKVGDTVNLCRNPDHDKIGVLIWGEAEGVALKFEGAMAEAAFLNLDVEPITDTFPAAYSGHLVYLVDAPHCLHVRATLVGLTSGSIHVGLQSGSADAMRAKAAKEESARATFEKAKTRRRTAVKLQKAAPTAG